MTKILDARGLACPAPVLMTKHAVEEEKPAFVTVWVNNEAAKENVTRFLNSQKFSVTTTKEGTDFKISGSWSGDVPAESTEPAGSNKAAEAEKQKIMVMATTDRMGFGDDELGRKLMSSFIKTLKEMGDELWRLVFVNNGVKLAIDGSPVLEDLMAYEKNGLTILVCGTCLSHFDLLGAKKVGETTNMLDIVTAMQVADKVINI
jgi:selenium metabolism protein YedF